MLVPAGKVLNYAGVSQLTPAEISARAAKILRFIDLGGHERYMKTALYGMTCMVRWFPGQPGAAKASMCAAFRPIRAPTTVSAHLQIAIGCTASTMEAMPPLLGSSIPCSCPASACDATQPVAHVPAPDSNPARGA